MTMALCFYCGELKLGALCPCSKCGTNATGYAELDILFSEHQITAEDLTKFGKVIDHFRSMTYDRRLIFWSFIQYLSDFHGYLLKAEIPNEYVDKVHDIYVESELPNFTIEVRH